MSIALAKYLVEEGLVGAAAMDDILQRQVLFGGSIDSNLIEAELLDESRLTQALAHVHRLPAATGDLLAKRDKRVSKLFPARLAQKYQVVPLVMSGRSLVLLAAGRVHPVVEDEIGFMLSLSVRTYLVCEARLKALLRDWLGLEIEPRYEALAAKLAPFEQVFAEPLLETPSQPALAPAPRVEESRIQQAINKLESVQRHDLERRSRSRSGDLSLQEARRLSLSVDDREELVDVVLRYARQFMPYVGLFVLHDEHIQGWDAIDQDAEEQDDAARRVRMVRLPLASPSVLRTVNQTQAYYLGALPNSGVNDELMRMLGRGRPRNVLIAPILVQRRLVGLLYGDAGKRAIRGRRISDLLVFVSGLSAAFEQLIRKRKLAEQGRIKEAGVLVPTPVDPLSGGRRDRSDAEQPEQPEQPAAATETPAETAVPEAVRGEAVVFDESFEDPGGEMPVIEADALGFPPPADGDAAQTSSIRRDERRVSIEDLADEPVELAYSVVDGESGDVVIVDTDGSFAPPESAASEPLAALEPEGFLRVPPEDDFVVGGLSSQPPARATEGLPGLAELQRFEKRLPRMVEALVSGDAERMDLARVEIMPFGHSALPELMKHFPGWLTFDVRARHDAVPALSEHGPLIRLLVDLGAQAVRAVADKLEDDEALARYYAVRFFGEVRECSVVPRLAGRLYDRDALVRLSAIDVLLTYRSSDHFKTFVKNLRQRLQSAMPDQQAIAAALLGNFKAREAVEDLIALVKSPDKMVARATQESLSFITKQDYGRSRRKWRKWHEAHQDDSRVEWLIAGLWSKNRDVRFSAHRELVQVTGHRQDYFFDASKSERDRAAKLWLQWWEETGSSMGFE